MRLYILDLGRSEIDLGAGPTSVPGGRRRVLTPVVGYLIHTDAGTNILVDTGMNRRHITDPFATIRGRPIAEKLTPIMRPEDDVLARLGQVGLTVQDVDVLICTHFHFDHAGNLADFGASRLLAQRACYEHAMTVGQALPELYNQPHLRYELLDGDTDLAPGVRLLETPGHVPGHQSVVVRLSRTGTVVLAIDAILSQESLDADNFQVSADPERARASARRLVDLARHEHGLLIFGHDPAQWETLRKAPEYYD
jgi:N-acyl homoserine lactone hydrolase